MTGNVGDQIKMIRLNNNLNQEEFGDKLGKTKQTVYRWEKGSIVPSIEAIQQVATVFDTVIHIHPIKR